MCAERARQIREVGAGGGASLDCGRFVQNVACRQVRELKSVSDEVKAPSGKRRELGSHA